MKIGIDGHVLFGKYQGTRTYLYNLIKELGRCNVNHEFLVLKKESQSIYDLESIGFIDMKNQHRAFDLLWGFGNTIRKSKLDVFYSQHFLPVSCPARKVVAIHDVLPITHKSYFTLRHACSRRYAFGLAARRADLIHTVSEYSKRSIVEAFGVSEEKVSVIPNGVDTAGFDEIDKTVAREYLSSIAGCADFYILTVGRVEARKNYLRLIGVFADVRKRYPDMSIKLVVVGHVEHDIQDLTQLISKEKLTDDVVFLSGVDEKSLKNIYKGSNLFVYPSIAEGFGIPPLEAMAAGTPVLSSDTTAMPEVLGSAAVYFDPLSAEQMASRIEDVISDEQLRATLIEKGYERVKMFTWRNAASKYLSSFDKLL